MLPGLQLLCQVVGTVGVAGHQIAGFFSVRSDIEQFNFLLFAFSLNDQFVLIRQDGTNAIAIAVFDFGVPKVGEVSSVQITGFLHQRRRAALQIRVEIRLLLGIAFHIECPEKKWVHHAFSCRR